MSNWKIIESEYVVKRPWLTARRDKVELSDGRIIPEYYVLEYPDWVNVIAHTKDGRFVMERQYRHAAGVTAFELPCGVVERGETPLDAARRELLEETGYGGGVWRKQMTISANPGTMTNWTHCFVAEGVEKLAEPNLDATEELSVHLLGQAEVKRLLSEDGIVQSLMVAPLWRYFSEADSAVVEALPTSFREG